MQLQSSKCIEGIFKSKNCGFTVCIQAYMHKNFSYEKPLELSQFAIASDRYLHTLKAGKKMQSNPNRQLKQLLKNVTKKENLLNLQ